MTRPKPVTPREGKSALARRLKIHRHALDAMLARPGAPAPDRKKQYDVREVVAFIASQRSADGGGLESLRAARLREIQLRCAKLERELALAARAVVTVEKFRDESFACSRHFRDSMFRGLTVDLPPKLVGMTDIAEVRRTLRNFGDEVLRRFLARCDEWEKNYVAGEDENA